MTNALSSAFQIAVSALLLTACGATAQQTTRSSMVSFPSRGPDCSFDVLGGEALPLDQMRYDVVGAASVSYSPSLSTEELHASVRAEVAEELCAWGGTAALVVFDSSATKHTWMNAPLRSGTTVWLLREAPPGEATAYAKRLGIGDDALIKQVAFDTDCPPASIEIEMRDEAQGHGRYVVVACGARLKYQREGNVYRAKAAPAASATEAP